LWTWMYHFYALNRAQFLQHYHKSGIKKALPVAQTTDRAS
jgi:hypothetical protein